MESVTIEILPPPINWSQERITKYCQKVAELLRKLDILIVDIPEVVNETRNGRRRDFVPKMDNFHFASLLKHYHHDIIVILCKICVLIDKQSFEEWVAQVYQKGIRHLVLVGGESPNIQYPGYTVLEATRFIKQRYPQIKLGGITIFTRDDEVERIQKKMDAGMEFFYSQIIFEAANGKQILLNLSKECKKKEISMPKIYLSIAIASKSKDIEFMKWLGVEFPSAVYSHLAKESNGDEVSRSKEVVDMMLDEIFHFTNKEKIDVGFNIEHVMYMNLYLIQQVYKDVKRRIAEA